MASPSVADNAVEYKLRVPRNLVKNYYVMKINAPRPIKFDDITEAHLSREKKPKVEEEEELAGPTYGAGSEYGKERKEESKKKRRTVTTMTNKKVVKTEDLPLTMRLAGKRYSGRKEGTILENASYYVLTQSPDGVFEAVPIQAWYNFIPNVHYHTLTADEVEEEFSKRDKTINFMNLMVKKRLEATDDNEEQANSKVRSKAAGDRLLIHDDDFLDVEMSDDEDEDDTEKKPGQSKKGKKKKKSKDHYQSKKKRRGDDDENDDSDEEEEFDGVESKEVGYMSEASSDDEELGLEDEPEADKISKKSKAKDDINAYTLSESEEEREADEELTNVGKELKEILKRETGEDETSGEEDEEDEDIDSSEKYTKSALFMQGGKEGKKKKGKSESGSASSSRSCTPTALIDGMQSNSPASAKKLSKEDKMGSAKKRPSSRIGQPDSSTPPPKKQKQSPQPPLSASPSIGGNGNNTNELTSITEEAIRRYLSHKPMTTTDLVKKFKHKKTGLTKEELVSTIAAILKRIGPERETIDGKLYLSIKPAKR